jgi:hypothetical protein
VQKLSRLRTPQVVVPTFAVVGVLLLATTHGVAHYVGGVLIAATVGVSVSWWQQHRRDRRS